MSTSEVPQGQSASSRNTASSNTAAASTNTDSSAHDPPFKTHRLRQLCKNKLPWSDNAITSWITKHALPYLKHWKTTCYDDPILRTTLNALLASPEKKQATRHKILDLCTNQKARLCSPSHFAALPTGPSRHVARTAMEIHLLCFSKLEDWAAAFAVCEDGGYETAVELVLEVFESLWRFGTSSWFYTLPVVGSKPEPSCKGGSHLKRKRETSNPEVDDELGDGSRKRTRVDTSTIGQDHAEKEPSEKSSKKRRSGCTKKPKRSTDELQPNTQGCQAPNKSDDGQALIRTRIRNDRKREQKKLKRFIAVGLLPPESNFAALRKRQEELEADREKGVERALAKAAEKSEREKAEQRRERLKVKFRFTGHRKELLREILSTGRDEAKKRNELAKRFPGYHGVESQSDPPKEVVACLSDWDEMMFRQAKERRAGGRDRREETEKEVIMSDAGAGDCVLGMGCERKNLGKDCIMCSTFGKV